MMEGDHFVAWSGATEEAVGMAVTKPYDGNPATVGHGSMVALLAATPEQCKQVYEKALELGGTDEGAPGLRDMPGFYAAYFRDLDGNKLNVFCSVPVE